MPIVNALCFSGRLKVTVASEPRRSTWISFVIRRLPFLEVSPILLSKIA
jgi:hypothetical protein